MKKLCFILIVFCLMTVFACQPPKEDWKKQVGLTQKQIKKVEEIERKYYSQYLLLQMEYQQTGNKEAYRKMMQTYRDKNKEITKILYFWQKPKYREILSRRY